MVPSANLQLNSVPLIPIPVCVIYPVSRINSAPFKYWHFSFRRVFSRRVSSPEGCCCRRDLEFEMSRCCKSEQLKLRLPNVVKSTGQLEPPQHS